MGLFEGRPRHQFFVSTNYHGQTGGMLGSEGAMALRPSGLVGSGVWVRFRTLYCREHLPPDRVVRVQGGSSASLCEWR